MIAPQARCPRCSRALPGDGDACSRCTPPGAPASPLPEELLAAAAEHPSTRSLDPAHRYRVLATLGRGGTGIVLKVHDQELDEVIALKVLDPRVDDPLARERFKQEIKIARRINHPNVARLYDLLVWNNRLAISQEFIDGHSLAEVMKRGPLPTEEIRTLLRYLCSALQAAHELAVVHRDLKPQNILIDRHNRPRIVDFGVAVLAGRTALDDRRYIIGTPRYMAPEQILHPERIGPRTDLYSLGVLIFHLSTGRPPFAGRTLQETMDAHVSSEPPRPRTLNPQLSVAIEEVTLRCLAKDPEDRFGSAQELFSDLEHRLRREHRDLDPPVAVHPSRRGKVLLIDDDDDLRALVRTVLRSRGCVVVEASDGFSGVESALAEQPDLILLDILMPRLDGRETLRILKSNPRTRGIPVVMVTSLTDEEEALFARESGAAAFLNKPIRRDVLDLLLERYVGGEPRT